MANHRVIVARQRAEKAGKRSNVLSRKVSGAAHEIQHLRQELAKVTRERDNLQRYLEAQGLARPKGT